MTAARQWRNFDWPQIQALAADSRFWQRPSERTCPACGASSLRTYVYASERAGRPTLVSYVWCSNCHRFAGSTGPRPAGFDFTDPLGDLTLEQRIALEEDMPSFFDHLDRLWNDGRLPQEFIRARR